ncbi:MAG: prolipoprotein diacylglyceryl transferase [Planctomycetes bacterium]|nr:prolipoprotein diacylglyceryl transferase [Planctomycetota bacterium]
MHPELLTLPGGYSIKTYGFCMMLGFLSSVWLAMRRAERVKADPDRVLDISFLCLLFGVGGARLFYVIHYWKTQFADTPNPFMAAIDITNGGLEFLGGFIGAVVVVGIYFAWKKDSLRLYLDIMAPSTMWGLAFGRLGCFFNGCCFGGVCALTPTPSVEQAVAVEFPFASPAHWKHWEDRHVTAPAELITTTAGMLIPALVPDRELSMSVNRRERPLRELEDVRAAYRLALAKNPKGEEAARLKEAREAAGKRTKDRQKEMLGLTLAQRFPSRVEASRTTSVSELEDLAAASRSLPVHPTQLYAAGSAMLLSAFLSALFYRRKRHGVVIGMLLLLYPIQRTILELIRADNPHDVAGLTVSQSISLGLFVLALIYFAVLYRMMPERSPHTRAAVAAT